jgi:hypothetical protein
VRARPHYAWLCLGVTLLACAHLCFVPGGPVTAPRSGQVVSLLSWLPDAWVAAAWPFTALRIVFFVCAPLWLLRTGLPFTSWGATLAFTALASLAQEGRFSTAHSANLPNQVLILFAIWTHLDRRDLRGGRFFERDVVPKWLPVFTVGLVGWFYTAAGVTKLADSGPGWADGLSLQLWVARFGDVESPFAQAILADRGLARAMQAVTLVFETGALAFALWRPMRIATGLALIGFHVGQLLVFGYPFHGNVALLALTFLPIRETLTSWHARCTAAVDG